MPPKRPYHHGDLRTALIRAALLLIDKNGVKGLALTDAAHLAGVSVAAPYRHFKDKEALLAEIANEDSRSSATRWRRPRRPTHATK